MWYLHGHDLLFCALVTVDGYPYACSTLPGLDRTMAITNQFSLSLELTKFLPGASLVSLAGRGLIQLMRELQTSGSDYITEGDLAEIFGRNRIDTRFASTLRTAVKHSANAVKTSHAEIGIIKLGFRAMQDFHWQMKRLPGCEHTFMCQNVVFPKAVWAFQGFDEPSDKIQAPNSHAGLNKPISTEWIKSPGGSVQMGLVAGDSSARWALSQSMLVRWNLLRTDTNLDPMVFLKGDDCCSECAVHITNDQRNGRHVGLVL